MKRIYLAFFVSIILQGSILSIGRSSITEDPKLYFFNPDFAMGNLGRLKHEIETYFEKGGYPVIFQAFSYQTDFDAKIREQQPQFLFAPDWYIKKNRQQLKIKPFLVPVSKGEPTYRMALLVAKNSKITLDAGEKVSLAMTPVGPDSVAFLNQVLFPGHDEKTSPFHPVMVPKSADALFALFLGHVDSALVAEEHLEIYRKMLPRIVGGVRPLVLSQPIPMPMFCYSEELVVPTDVEKFKAVLLDEESNRIHKDLPELLQIDEWQETGQ